MTHEEFVAKYEPVFGKHAYPLCGEGWLPIVAKALDKLALIDPVPQVLQIKEKFGGLRMYVTPWNDQVAAITGKAEREASITCEICGDTGIQRNMRWIRTLCDKH